MFTINLEDGREAPSKARKKDAKRLEFLVFNTLEYTEKKGAREFKKNFSLKIRPELKIENFRITIL